VLYNTTSGALFYDADGSGTAQAPVPFATLSGGVGVSNLDFLVT
ncbi:MAG: calcium-binding protein, partial [Candidatus Accumulibacter sp.]|nr:calcium-binding protein [Accumulibacter sp.]